MDLNDRVSVKNDAIPLTSSVDIHGSATVLEKIDEVQGESKVVNPLDTTITGKGQLWQRMNPYVVKTFVTSITAAVILMSLLMVGVFGPLLWACWHGPQRLSSLAGSRTHLADWARPGYGGHSRLQFLPGYCGG